MPSTPCRCCSPFDAYITIGNGRIHQLEGDDEGLVYARPTAVDFESISDSQISKTTTTYCGSSVDLNSVASSILQSGVANVVSFIFFQELVHPRVQKTQVPMVSYDKVSQANLVRRRRAIVCRRDGAPKRTLVALAPCFLVPVLLQGEKARGHHNPPIRLALSCSSCPWRTVDLHAARISLSETRCCPSFLRA